MGFRPGMLGRLKDYALPESGGKPPGNVGRASRHPALVLGVFYRPGVTSGQRELPQPSSRVRAPQKGEARTREVRMTPRAVHRGKMEIKEEELVVLFVKYTKWEKVSHPQRQIKRSIEQITAL